MRVLNTSLRDVLILEPDPFVDGRGFFVRTMDSEVLAAAGIDHCRFVQESQSRSSRGVLRGLHGRRHLSEAKLVRCSRGRIFDVAVDLRPWSATFRTWETFLLDDERHHQIFLPPGFAHGFQVLSDQADVCYRMDARYDPSLDFAVAYDDPQLSIPWPLEPVGLSDRDSSASALADIEDQLDKWFPKESR